MKAIIRITTLGILFGSLLIINLILAGQAVSATLDYYVIGGGGGRLEAGIYTLEGTIGQTVGGDAATVGLCSGFWCTLDSSSFFPWSIFIPAITGAGH